MHLKFVQPSQVTHKNIETRTNSIYHIYHWARDTNKRAKDTKVLLKYQLCFLLKILFSGEGSTKWIRVIGARFRISEKRVDMQNLHHLLSHCQSSDFCYSFSLVPAISIIYIVPTVCSLLLVSGSLGSRLVELLRYDSQASICDDLISMSTGKTSFACVWIAFWDHPKRRSQTDKCHSWSS